MIYDLIIIGAGIAGMTAARLAAEHGLQNVILLDYQKTAGGFTRPYWVTDEFALERQLFQQSDQLPYEIRTESTVVGFFPGEPHQLYVQSPSGTYSLETKRILIASGALEKPREAHSIPGTRPAGVMTPMMAVQLLERGYLPGDQIALFENGRIARATAAMLKEKAGEVLSFSAETWELHSLSGFARVDRICWQHHQTGEVHELRCDALLYAKGRIPSTFFLKGTPVERDQHGAVVVDQQGRTNLPHVFAAGSCTVSGMDDHENSSKLAIIAMDALLKEL